MRKLVVVLGLFCLQAPLARGYQKDAHSESLLRKALQQSTRPELSQCALPHGMGLLIKDVKTHLANASVCVTDLGKKDLPRECMQIENSAGSVDGYDSGEAYIQVLRQELMQNIPRVERASLALMSGEALLLTTLKCDQKQALVSTAVSGEGENAVFRVLETDLK